MTFYRRYTETNTFEQQIEIDEELVNDFNIYLIRQYNYDFDLTKEQIENILLDEKQITLDGKKFYADLIAFIDKDIWQTAPEFIDSTVDEVGKWFCL